MTDAHSHSSHGHCAVCGDSTDDADRHVRFTWPDPMLAIPEAERLRDSWMSDDTASQSVMLEHPIGAFVRVLLPVCLDDGTSITYGAWLAIDPALLRRTYELWWSDAYPAMTLQGRLANDVPPAGALGDLGEAHVLQEDQLPYLVRSSDPALSRLLTETWPAADFR